MTGPTRWIMVVWAALALMFLLTPFLFVALASFGADQTIVFPPHHFTLKWYAGINPDFFYSFGLSVALAAVTATGAVMLGIPAAIALARSSLPAKPAIETFLRAPLQAPQLVIGVAFLQFYRLTEDLTGIQLAGTLSGLFLAHLSFSVPYAISAITAALANVNPNLEEAAYSLGANRLSALRRVTLPAIRPGIAAAMFFAFITSFENVPVSLFLVGSGVTTLPIMIFEEVQFAIGPSIMAVSTLVVAASVILILTVQHLAGITVGPKQSSATIGA